jgi:hypothetical protein
LTSCQIMLMSTHAYLGYVGHTFPCHPVWLQAVVSQDVPASAAGEEDPLKAYRSMDAEQLRAQVEVLLDSVKSWEERVRRHNRSLLLPADQTEPALVHVWVGAGAGAAGGQDGDPCRGRATQGTGTHFHSKHT